MPSSRTSLASAAWTDRHTVERELGLRPGDFYLGRSDTDDAVPLGFSDDRHICLTCGNRGGKGTSLIVNNLCGWSGSVVVIDPKGENATLTATRRGNGSARVTGLGQKVYVLDPFGAAKVPEEYRATFNPLDALHERDEDVTILAGEIANALVVQSPEAKESKFFDESARTMLKALILHVLTSPWFDDEERNLLTVRRLLMRGAWKDVAAARREKKKLLKEEKKKRTPSAQMLLWLQVKQNQSCGGILQDHGASFANLLRDAPETYEGVRQTARTNMDFVEDAAMTRLLEKSTPEFSLSALKSDPKGVSIYLSLPDDYMETHSRWLRLMITLTIGACRKLDYQPLSGPPILMVLDEFAGLQRMPIIENAVAKMAGYGLKMFFVLQSLEQLKATYPDRWQTFLANCGVSIFFGLSRLDLFTAEHVSKAVGETEIIRVTRSVTLTNGITMTKGDTFTVGQSLSATRNVGTSTARQRGWNNNQGETITKGLQGGTNRTDTSGINAGESTHWGQTTGVTIQTGKSTSSGPGGSTSGTSEGTATSSSSTVGGGRHSGWSQSTANGVSEGWSDAVGRSITGGESGGNTDTESSGTTQGESTNYSQARSLSRAITSSVAVGFTETLHVRPLLQTSEINVLLRRVNDDRRSGPSLPDYRNATYPGMALVLVDGENPCLVRRTNYHEDPCFIGYFEKHPDHEWKNPRIVDVDLAWLWQHFKLKEELLTVKWLAGSRDRVLRGQTVGEVSVKGRKELKPLSIVAVNDGVFNDTSFPSGDYGRHQIIAYQLLTSQRTPRPDIEADGKPKNDTGVPRRRLKMLPFTIAFTVVALAIVSLELSDPGGSEGQARGVIVAVTVIICLIAFAAILLLAPWINKRKKVG